MTLADILVVMNGGQVEQIGNPLDIYKKPATTFVATFIGAPPMNLMPMRYANLHIPGSPDGVIGIRPEDLEIANQGPPDGGIAFELTVSAIEHVGAETFIYGMRPQQGDADTISAKPGEPPPGEILVRIPGQQGPAIGESIKALAPREKLHLFVAGGRKRVDL
jgi:sn-glycerol 3-phosphate transport system ATP-binding protein